MLKTATPNTDIDFTGVSIFLSDSKKNMKYSANVMSLS